jgi:hypothetical protein
MLALQQLGYVLLVPFGENVRYDLVIDDGESLARVQCKTGRLRGGAVRFNACSSYAHHPNPRLLRRHYEGQIEYFGVHCPDNGAVYLVPWEAAPRRTQVSLRVDPAANNQVVGIRYAGHYEIARLVPSP